MNDWQEQLEKFLGLYKYDILQNAGTVSAEDAKQKARPRISFGFR